MPMLGGVKLTPLPASVLPSTMAVCTPVLNSEYGDEWAKAVTITHVRFMGAGEFALAQSAGAQSGYVFREGSVGMVIVDAVTSGGAFAVPEGSKLTIDGGEPLIAVRVTCCQHMDGSPHHWEIEVR